MTAYETYIHVWKQARKRAMSNSKQFAAEAHMSTKTITLIEKGYLC